MITITALKWVPEFAAGNVRDHRARWILEEVGWPYEVRLLDAPTAASGEHLALQPFGQVPSLVEEGRAPLFESGAIVLDVATRAGRLLPDDADLRARTICWMFAALNTVEPPLMNLAEVDHFIDDEAEKARRRPVVLQAVRKRLGQVAAALGDRAWLVGDDFTIADLMMSSVLKIVEADELARIGRPLAAYRARCLARPAYRKAVGDQCATIARHGPEDMRFDAVA